MKRVKPTLCLITAFLISVRCTDVVQVKLDKGSELIVIDAFLESQYDAQAIFIHKNSTYFNSEEPEPITNASATLYDLTEDKSYKFQYVRDDRYEIEVKKESFVANHQYKLEINIEGSIYTALTTQPRAASIDSISAKAFTKDQFTGEVKPLYYSCYLWAKDKADNNPDYYWIKSNRDSAFINLCIDGTAGIVRDAPTDSIYFSTPYSLLGYATYAPGNLCYVSVCAISKETYDFLEQAQKQINNGGLFATTPENIKTNFTTPTDAKRKAVGWFSVANACSANKDIPK
ncbi:DUF4249 family protein [Aurantibacillus circumpalustris]|uniref:DUF4249 family protein n=1 Tax=Aurantibacillus circumpalustris TaxID=3036359 RepID=UPI00295B9BCA|nr:DUF4249 family protein [Aurantibacillus circumpalustris]